MRQKKAMPSIAGCTGAHSACAIKTSGIRKNERVERFELSREEVLDLMKDETCKIELINNLPEGEVIARLREEIRDKAM